MTAESEAPADDAPTDQASPDQAPVSAVPVSVVPASVVLAAGDDGLIGQRRPPGVSDYGSPAELTNALADVGYLADDGLATAGFLALRLGRPLFLEGDAGVGKTAFAQALAEATGAHFVRLSCYEGIDSTQALYDWDFPRQILHLRTLEATGALLDADTVEASLYDRRFLLARPLLEALEHDPCVLLVDEIDRADDEFEAFLLEMLADAAITIPELGRIAARTPPLTVLTSNRTREVHDALKRRCLYHWVEHPGFEREVQILRTRLPQLTARLADEVATAAGRMRTMDLLKPPGVAESIDWAGALMVLGARTLDPDVAASTLGTVLKYREDADRVRASGLAALIGV
jgi:MoxR-like ATPase